MKIGDKVRFIDEVGGGIVAGFQGNLVLVEDEDGFKVPMQKGSLVVVEDTLDSDKQAVGMQKSTDGTPKEPLLQPERAYFADQKSLFEEPKEPLWEEREGGNKLNCYLAFVPTDFKSFTTTTFDSYFVNDSNYFIRFSYLIADGASWTLRAAIEVEPNTKELIETFSRDVLNDYDRIAIQLLAYKKDKPFMLKPACDVCLRMDTVKFYKLHCFVENDFFDEPALLYPIVEDDRPMRPLTIDANTLKQEMYGKTATNDKEKPSRSEGDGYVRRYDDKRGGNPFIVKRRDDNAEIVDLHAHNLLETTAGMTAADILNYQTETIRKTMEKYKSEKGKRIIFIHGKGEGVLRQALLHELKYRYKTCRYQDASFQEYGYGATQVTIR